MPDIIIWQQSVPPLGQVQMSRDRAGIQNKYKVESEESDEGSS